MNASEIPRQVFPERGILEFLITHRYQSVVKDNRKGGWFIETFS